METPGVLWECSNQLKGNKAKVNQIKLVHNGEKVNNEQMVADIIFSYHYASVAENFPSQHK